MLASVLNTPIAVQASVQVVRTFVQHKPLRSIGFRVEEEASALRSQFAISKPGRGGRCYLPYAFTEHRAIMLANALNILHTSALPKER